MIIVKEAAASIERLVQAQAVLHLDKLAYSQRSEAAERDAARGRYMLENGCWHRGEEQTHLAVLVEQGSDLSCYAMRAAAIDAAMKAKP